MMYKKNFVAAIKLGGKVLRESNDRVELPFGSEYSILLKNLDTVRVRTSIQIDGENAVEGVIIQPNSEIEIERFLRKSGSLDQGNRFKFIERTAKIEDHRGIKADDGIVRIEFEREKVYNPPVRVEHHTYHHHYPWYYHGPSWGFNYPYTWTSTTGLQGQTVNSSHQKMGLSSFVQHRGPTGQSVSSSLGDTESISALNYAGSVVADFQKSDVGITVDGSISSQRFVPVQGFECEAADVVILHLVGRHGVSPIKVAKTVRAKLSCETCGTKNKSSVKFCKECGTSLEKV